MRVEVHAEATLLAPIAVSQQTDIERLMGKELGAGRVIRPVPPPAPGLRTSNQADRRATFDWTGRQGLGGQRSRHQCLGPCQEPPRAARLLPGPVDQQTDQSPVSSHDPSEAASRHLIRRLHEHWAKKGVNVDGTGVPERIAVCGS